MKVKFVMVCVFRNGRFPLIRQSTGTTVHTTCCNVKNICILATRWPVLMRFSGQTVSTSLHIIHWLVFVMESHGVFSVKWKF